MTIAEAEVVPGIANAISRPHIQIEGANVELVGAWTLSALYVDAAATQRKLGARSRPDVHWDLRGVDALDEFGALLLWRAWQWRLPALMLLRTQQEAHFAKLPASVSSPRARQRTEAVDLLYGAD